MGTVVCCLCGTEQSGFKSSLTIKIGPKEFSLCKDCSDLFEVIRDKHHARYARTALVAYNAYFADGNDFSKKEYLERIVLDSLRD